MKKYTFKFISILIGLASFTFMFSGCNKKSEVIVYANDSFAAEWGPAPEIAKRFKEATGLTVTFVSCGNAGETLRRAILEKDSPQADILVGVDDTLYEQAKEADIFKPYKPANAESLIEPEVLSAFGNEWLVTPYDYGCFAMIYDTQSTLPAPEKLEDLTKDIYRQSVIIMSPETSTAGLGFLAWTVAQFPDSYIDFWTKFTPNIFRMTNGWSEGWGFFTSGEAPLVISYTTSPAYNVIVEKETRFKTIIFPEGHIEQVEGFGLLKNAPNEKEAKIFMDFMLSEKAQSVLPETQWMYPSNKNIELSQEFVQSSPKPAVVLSVDSKKVTEAIPEVLKIVQQ